MGWVCWNIKTVPLWELVETNGATDHFKILFSILFPHVSHEFSTLEHLSCHYTIWKWIERSDSQFLLSQAFLGIRILFEVTAQIHNPWNYECTFFNSVFVIYSDFDCRITLLSAFCILKSICFYIWAEVLSCTVCHFFISKFDHMIGWWQRVWRYIYRILFVDTACFFQLI